MDVQLTKQMRRLAGIGWLVSLMLCVMASSAPAVQLQDLVRIKGSETSKLVGMGLVVGLNGTGDGGKFLPAMRPLAHVISKLIDPNVVAGELQNASNVALVSLTAEIPPTGVREGDHIDVHVSAVGPAKSLKGGRLFLVPMIGPMPNSPTYAYAEGPIALENKGIPTEGVISGGAQLTRDVLSQYMDSHGNLELVINQANASWPVANNLTNRINGLMAPDGPNIAQAVDQKNILVHVPKYDHKDPASFISQILQIYIDPANVDSGAKVVINERTGTIVVSGDVEISPVIISHKGLTITTLSPPVKPTPANPKVNTKRFIALDPSNRGGTKLSNLLAAFNQLKVKTQDRIDIIKLIHKSGKLHGKLIFE